MPCRNSQRTIAGAINSILSQTYDNWELVIVDDGSTDNTRGEIEKFKDKRIKSFYLDHEGIAKTRNYGNQVAQGTYCIVQDSDDYSLPDRLEKVVRLLQRTKADIVTHSAYVNVWNDQYKCLERKYLKATPVDKKKMKISQYLPGWPAYKKEVWEKRPFREETKYVYDYSMHLDWIFSGFKYEVLDEGLYEYIRYFGSASDRFEREGKRAKSMKALQEIMKKEYNIIINAK